MNLNPISYIPFKGALYGEAQDLTPGQLDETADLMMVERPGRNLWLLARESPGGALEKGFLKGDRGVDCIDTDVELDIHICINTYIYMYIYICIHIYIYTQIWLFL